MDLLGCSLRRSISSFRYGQPKSGPVHLPSSGSVATNHDRICILIAGVSPIEDVIQKLV